MKKISLKNLNLKAVEQLSRAQLKDILGGGVMSKSDPESGITTDSDCGTSCEEPGDSCTTSSCESGTCSYQGETLGCATS